LSAVDKDECSDAYAAFMLDCGADSDECSDQETCCSSLTTYKETVCEGKELGDKQNWANFGCDARACVIENPTTCASWGFNYMNACGALEEECADQDYCCDTYTGLIASGACANSGKKQGGVEFACNTAMCAGEADTEECQTLYLNIVDTCGVGNICAAEGPCCGALVTYVNAECMYVDHEVSNNEGCETECTTVRTCTEMACADTEECQTLYLNIGDTCGVGNICAAEGLCCDALVTYVDAECMFVDNEVRNNEGCETECDTVRTCTELACGSGSSLSVSLALSFVTLFSVWK
jgi:hypothetical protein